MSEPGKWIVIGIHLEHDDAAAEGIDVLSAGELFASCVRVPADASLATPHLIKSVAGLRSKLLDRALFVAVRYGSTIRAQQELQPKIAQHSARWRELLQSYRGHVEITLKVAPEQKSERPDATTASSGGEYLRRLHEIRKPRVDDAFRSAVETRFAGAAMFKWQSRTDGGVEFAALIPRSDIETLRAVGEALRESFPATPFIISGPWPLEVFADE